MKFANIHAALALLTISFSAIQARVYVSEGSEGNELEWTRNKYDVEEYFKDIPDLIDMN